MKKQQQLLQRRLSIRLRKKQLQKILEKIITLKKEIRCIVFLKNIRELRFLILKNGITLKTEK